MVALKLTILSKSKNHFKEI